MRSKTVKVVVTALLVLLVILLIIAQAVAPRIAASYVEREIKKRYPDCKKVKAEVKAVPFFKLLFSEYDRIKVKAGGITIEGVTFDEVTLESDDDRVADYDAWVTQEEIFQVFSTANSYLDNPTLVMEDGFINVYGTVINSNPKINVHIRGTLKVVDVTNIFLVPELIEIESPYNIPSAVNQIEEKANTTPIFTLKENLAFSVSEINIAAGKMEIKGYVDLDRILK